MVDVENVERIKQLKGKYFRALDTARLAELREIFLADASVTFRSPSYEFDLQGWDDLEPFFDEHFTDTRFGLHHGHNPEIRVDGDDATGVWYLHDVFINLEEETRLEGSAVYRDQYRRVDSGWRIASMDYERLFEMTQPLPDGVDIAARPTRR